MLSISLVLLLVGCAKVTESNEGGDAASDAIGAVESAETSLIASPSRAAGSTAQMSEVAVRREAEKRYRDYLCESPEECYAKGEGVLGAKFVEEAVWLKQFGYPTARELRELRGMSAAQLKRAADGGSMPAMALYGERVALSGSAEEGVEILKETASKGSVYAYYALSRVYESARDIKDPVESAAYLRMAFLSGDSNAADHLMSRYSTSGSGPADFLAVDRRAGQLYRELGMEQPLIRPSEPPQAYQR